MLLALVVVGLGCGDEVEGLRVAVAGAEAVNRCCQLRNHLEADRQGVMSVTACEQAVDAGCLVDVDRVGDVVKELRGDVPRFVVGENANAVRLLVRCATAPGSEDATFGAPRPIVGWPRSVLLLGVPLIGTSATTGRAL